MLSLLARTPIASLNLKSFVLAFGNLVMQRRQWWDWREIRSNGIHPEY
jgi:hypothetical protein